MDTTLETRSIKHESLTERIDNLERRVHRLTMDSVTRILKKEGLVDKILESDEIITQVLDSPLAILSIDLDLFKGINDEYGHKKGDEYLSSISSKIDYHAWGNEKGIGFCFRGKEGDEIVAVLGLESNSADEYVNRVNEFVSNMDQSLKELGQHFPKIGIDRTNPSISVGAVFEPNGIKSDSPQKNVTLLLDLVDNKADIAVYDTKRRRDERPQDKLVDVTFFENIANV